MGRVETRIYMRKRSRARAARRIVLLLLLAVGFILLWRGMPNVFNAERIASPSPTPVTSDFDQSVQTREVTLSAETWYAIQTGVFSTEEAARQKADAYTDRAAPGVVVQEGEKWRVFIACYGTEAAASAVRTRLEENQRVDTYLYIWECPELRLRLTGMAGQLDVVEAGFTLLTSTAAALRDTATELDAAQLTTSEANKAVSALDGQIILWEETVRSRFGRNVPALVEGMLSITQSWSARCGEIQSAANATEMSAALKAQAMGLFDEICAWRRAVAEQ